MRNAPRIGWSRRLAAGVVLTLGVAGSAQAYIDPGTGSMLLQMMGAGIAGAIFYFREFRMKIIAMFTRREAPAAEDGSEPPPGGAPS